ncbi:MAG: FRG domain-containing protein [Sedimentisphaerales bacterium]|jgi:hypothetical protein
MMKEQTLKSWEEFEDELIRINKETKSLQEKKQGHISYPLFRGVDNSEYHLESTLDRIQKGMSLSDYYRIMNIVHMQIASCTGKKWDMEKELPMLCDFRVKACEFMVYLRHNGFPSPLLDWSRSPYIAAYFSFRDLSLRGKLRKHVSIFMYREFMGVGKSTFPAKPHIISVGPSIITDPKHYLQQSEYTLCLRNMSVIKAVGDVEKECIFADYGDVTPFLTNDGDGPVWECQDVVVKYNIPISEQQKVLRKLDSMNITAYSLFNSEPSLMETLALRELFLT